MYNNTFLLLFNKNVLQNEKSYYIMYLKKRLQVGGNKMTKTKSPLASFLKVSLDILIAIAVIIYVVIIIRSVSSKPDFSSLRNTITYSLFLIGGGGLYVILSSLRRIVNSLITSNPLIHDNVKRIRNISTACFVVAAGYILNFFINGQYLDFRVVYIDNKGIHTDLEFLIFFFSGCFILILSEVFKKAVEVKEENDYTI